MAPTVSLGKATGQPLNTSIGEVRAEPWQQATKTPVVKIDPSQAHGTGDTGAGAFTIRELTGPQRTITLRDRALPYKPIMFSGTHTIAETKYAGYPRKSQQALGAEEDDTEVKGQWKTRFIGDKTRTSAGVAFEVTGSTAQEIDGVEVVGVDSSQITDSANACEILDEVRRMGRVVRVSWLHIVRIGRVEKFSQSWTTAHDVDWTIKFKWIGRDEDVGTPSPGESTLVAIAASMSSGYVDLHDATNFDGFDDIEPNLADQIDYRVGRIQRGVLELEATIEKRLDAVASPLLAIRRAAQLATFVQDECQSLIDYLGSIVSASMIMVIDNIRPLGAVVASTPPALRDFRGVSCGRSVAAGAAIQAAIAGARALKHKAARQRFAALKQVESDALAVVVLAQDEDLQRLCKKFYGSAENADHVRSYNNLDTFSPPRGTVIVMPKIGGQL